jgi:hypothetical protein
VIVNVAAPPRTTDEVEVVFVIESDGVQPVTVTVAGLVVLALPSLPEPTLALLLYAPQLLAPEGAVAVKVTDAVWPGARVQALKVRIV